MIKDMYLVLIILLLNFTVKSVRKEAILTAFFTMILVFSVRCADTIL